MCELAYDNMLTPFDIKLCISTNISSYRDIYKVVFVEQADIHARIHVRLMHRVGNLVDLLVYLFFFTIFIKFLVMITDRFTAIRVLRNNISYISLFYRIRSLSGILLRCLATDSHR